MRRECKSTLKRREFLQVAGFASAGITRVEFAAVLPSGAAAKSLREDDFMLLQMSDTRAVS